MKRTTKKSEKQPVKRVKYTLDQKEQARKYYLMGLSLQEISKLLDGTPVRTLEKWQIRDKWKALKETEPLKQRVLSMQQAGKSYREIADILKVSRVTVYRWIKQAKQ